MNCCVFCGKNIAPALSLAWLFSTEKLKKSPICSACRRQFQPINLAEACPGCSYPQRNRKLCRNCQQWQKDKPAINLQHTALFRYNKMSKDYMKAFKVKGDLILAEVFAEELARALKGYQHTHHIIPIPISPASQASRGFNQVQLLLEKAGIGYEDWLIHTGTDHKQAGKTRKERLSVEQFLAVHLEAGRNRQLNKPLLIIDDIYTTGSTLMHAKEAFYTTISEREGQQALEMTSFSLFR